MDEQIALTRVDAKRRTLIPMELSEGVEPGAALLWVRRGNTFQFTLAANPARALEALVPLEARVMPEQKDA